MSENMTDPASSWGVLVANLGTPTAPKRRPVARFLSQFLSDPRVVDLPRWLWLPLLNLVIIPLRASRSAAAYRKIWWDEGSPLMVLTERLSRKLAAALAGTGAVVTGMRYGEPSIAAALSGLRDAGTTEVVVLPLYPQYSGTTTESIHDAVETALGRLDWRPRVVRIDDYHDFPAWIDAVARSIGDFRKLHGTAERLIFSLHGIPQRYVHQGDPYEQQCRASVAAIAAAAGLEPQQWMLTFQSRVGREPWLQPYTDKTLAALAAEGVRWVQVVCPGFAVDCLETLEEIAMQNRELFAHAGGHKLEYIPALNDSDAHVAVLRQLIDYQRSKES